MKSAWPIAPESMMADEKNKEIGQEIADRVSKRDISIEELKTLIARHNPDLDMPDKFGNRTALGWAAKFDMVEYITVLLDNGANIGHRYSVVHCTALHDALTFACRRAIALLLERNAPVNICDSTGTTPLMVAAWQNNMYGLECIMKYDPDLLMRDNTGRIALDIAVERGNDFSAKKLEAVMKEKELEIRLYKEYLANGLPSKRALPSVRLHIRRRGR